MSGPDAGRAAADGLIAYLAASPTPFHACAESARQLEAAGFTRLAERDRWPAERGRWYLVRGGSLIAWSTEHAADATTGWRMVGAHTDSPNLRLKPQSAYLAGDWRMLGVEPYGGGIWASWLDRDLGLAGRAVAGRGADRREVLFDIDKAILRVSRLAIHLDRDEATPLNRQLHLAPAAGLGHEPVDVRSLIADAARVPADELLAWEAMTYDLQPAGYVGLADEFVAGARMDNLATSYAGTRALIDACAAPGAAPVSMLLALFDHEEIGSQTDRGAASALLSTVLERVATTLGGGRDEMHRALAASVIASGDMAHATHPNRPDRHEPHHQVAMNGGPVLKLNVNGRYATDAPGQAAFELACAQAQVPVQRFVVRSDLPCGSTVGPVTAALTGVTTVDFGAPTLSMHSVRELVGTDDQRMYAAALTAFLAPA